MQEYSRQDIEELRRRPLGEIFALALIKANPAHRGLTVSVYRIINAKSGRCRAEIVAGADGMMIGGDFTQRERPPAEDRR